MDVVRSAASPGGKTKMRHSDSKNRALGGRVPLVVLAVVLLAGVGWLAKGSGLKTWFTWHVLGRVPYGYEGRPHDESPSRRVWLPSDAMVQFDRFPQQASAGTAFTCVRFGPDGKL